MPSRSTDDDDADLAFDLLGVGVDTVEQRRACGCVTRIQESVVILETCGDPVHAERLGLFWKTVAHAHDMTFGLEVPEGESIRELTCGCGWRLSGGTLYVIPCETEHHGDALVDVFREFCRDNQVDLNVVMGLQ